MRESNGQFSKGFSGNEGGRPKVTAEVRELARQHGPRAIEVLAEILDDTELDPRARIAAATALLDRGFGRPEQSVHQHFDNVFLRTPADREAAAIEANEMLDRILNPSKYGGM